MIYLHCDHNTLLFDYLFKYLVTIFIDSQFCFVLDVILRRSKNNKQWGDDDEFTNIQ